MSKTPTAPKPAEIGLTLEDVARLADGAGNLPDSTAVRLRALILCDDPSAVEGLWRELPRRLEQLRRMAEDAGVELLEDALFALRCLGHLRSPGWQQPADVLGPRLEVPYRELIAMAGALAGRARGAERRKLERLAARLIAAQVEEIRGEDFVDRLIDRLLEVDDAVAEKVLGRLAEIYRTRQASRS